MTQIHYLKWPNLQAPSHPGPMLTLVKDIRQEVLSMERGDCTIVVHCSDGSGRTGTLISLYQLMEMMDERFESNRLSDASLCTTTDEMIKNGIDVFETVFNLRSRRSYMVSNKNMDLTLEY